MAGTSTPRKGKRVNIPETGGIDSSQSYGEMAAAHARPIRTPDEYGSALERISMLLREPHEEGSVNYDVLELLSILVETYEKENVPDLGEASPQEIVQFMAEQKEMEPADLALLMGGRSRLSEFMSGKRNLSLGQIRMLRKELGIPADLLIA